MAADHALVFVSGRLMVADSFGRNAVNSYRAEAVMRAARKGEDAVILNRKISFSRIRGVQTAPEKESASLNCDHNNCRRCHHTETAQWESRYFPLPAESSHLELVHTYTALPFTPTTLAGKRPTVPNTTTRSLSSTV